MTNSSSFTDKERAKWHEDRLRKRQGTTAEEISSASFET